jgi:methylated-DNA-protein-cysteine methyltransferase-like protein
LKRRAVRGALSSGGDLVRERLLAVVDSIPRGSVATYGQVAREAGLPRHARLVGAVLGALPAKSSLPWHRVLNAQGRVSPRDSRHCRAQRGLLEAEGVAFDARGRVDLARFRWRADAHDRGREVTWGQRELRGTR